MLLSEAPSIGRLFKFIQGPPFKCFPNSLSISILIKMVQLVHTCCNCCSVQKAHS